MRAYFKARWYNSATDVKTFDKALRPFILPTFAPLFVGDSHLHGEHNFRRARAVLARFGFLQAVNNIHEKVGVMHQLVQQAVREHVMCPDMREIPPRWTAQLLNTVESNIRIQYRVVDDDIHRDPALLARLRRLTSCVEQWCKHMCQPVLDHMRGHEMRAYLFLDQVAGVHDCDGAYTEALRYYKKSLEFHQNHLPRNNHLIGIAMLSVATANFKLNRYEDAEEHFKQSLKILQQAFPEGHLDVAKCMYARAENYFAMGKCKDAQALGKLTLALRKHFLPKDDPLIAKTEGFLARTNVMLRGNSPEAITTQEECLKRLQQELQGAHPLIMQAMQNLAMMYVRAGELDKGVKLEQDVLALRKKNFPKDHFSQLT